MPRVLNVSVIFLHELFAIKFHHVIRVPDRPKNLIKHLKLAHRCYTVMQGVYTNVGRVTGPHGCVCQILPSDVIWDTQHRVFLRERALVMCPTSVWMSPLLLHCTNTAGSLIPAELEKNWDLPRRSAHFMLNVAATAERQGWRKVQKASRLPAASHWRIEPLSGQSF